jgi:predicted ATPase/class 3 adenylate cyclase
MTDLSAWLASLGLEQYAATFAENAIDHDLLPTLTADDLKEIGVAALGHRKTLLAAIAALAEAPASSSDTPAAPTVSPPSGPAERRQLTVMFVDLVGSTALASRLDPEDMGAVLRGYQNAVAGEILRLDGHVAKFMGDGVLAYFGWPRAHEDEAERAVRAGLATVSAVASLEGGDAPLACRVGIATGLVVVGDLIGKGTALEQTVVGETPNLAARLQAAAAPSQIVIAETTRLLVGAAFELAPLPAQDLKGMEAPVTAFAVLGERAAGSRFEQRASTGLLPMVGRDQELALLMERWSQARSGEGQGVLLVGEAGIGKSRITRALLDAVIEEPHFRVRYQCSPYHADSSLWPVIQQLSRAAGFVDQDSREQKLDKLEAMLAKAGDTTAAPLFASLLGLDAADRYGALQLTPQAQRSQTLGALIDQLVGLSRRRPVLVVLEDAHWIDPTTLELIEQALDRGAAAPVLLLLTSRPENQPALAGHPHVTRLTLNRLGRGSVEAIVERLSSGSVRPVELIDTIIARTDGVPLFVEELTKAVIESGEATIPASLHDSLMARLDRLSEVKEVAQIAACFGREFGFRALAAVADRPEGDLVSALDKLTAAELVFRRGSPPDARYTFKHALVRDAAYDSLLKSRRQQLHRSIYDALSAEIEMASPDILAVHAAGAGRHLDAARHGLAAGRHALDRWAPREAVQHLRRASDHLTMDGANKVGDELELEVQRWLAPALLATYGYSAEDTGRAYSRTATLARAANLVDIEAEARFGSFLFHLVRGDLAEAMAVAEAKLADAADDQVDRAMAHRAAGTCALFEGSFDLAKSHLNDASAHLATSSTKPSVNKYVFDPGTSIAAFSSLASLALGKIDEAEALQRRSRELAKAADHVATLAFIHHHACFYAMVLGRADIVQTLATDMLQLAEREHLDIWLATGLVYSGWSKAVTTPSQGAVCTLDDGLARWQATGARLWQPVYLALRADALVALDRSREAAASLEQAHECAAATSEGHFTCEIHRRLSTVHLTIGEHDTAEHHLLSASRLAQEQRGQLYRLRASRDLARLWAERGERQRALDLLAPVYDWFTEGFETPDLVEAKALLDELR